MTFDTKLAGKVAIVTGAARGIGRVFSLALAGEGARVVAADVVDPAATAAEIAAQGGQALARRCDITDAAQLAELVMSAESAWGPVRVLVNNASLFASLAHTRLMDMSAEEWDRVMTINARGTLQACQAVVPSMLAGGGGKIVNIASGTVYYGPPGLGHYTASKAAVVALTRTLSRELGDRNIQVNAINPGLTESDSIRDNPQFEQARGPTIASRAIRREMRPEDLVGSLLYLCSSASDFVTGQTLNVDGGKVNT
jgi:NAD(P)-dependent dehydrogenase (short-subunit alcohol dehydrogenase family)